MALLCERATTTHVPVHEVREHTHTLAHSYADTHTQTSFEVSSYARRVDPLIHRRNKQKGQTRLGLKPKEKLSKSTAIFYSRAQISVRIYTTTTTATTATTASAASREASIREWLPTMGGSIFSSSSDSRRQVK